ncbi:hypothetical protein vBVpPWS1_03 [Vibrio phage vB_VpP_WS1]|nr:hypothetical protein vBVpPWS1_03 [Vibrio phage vB_VpP_WS1]
MIALKVSLILDIVHSYSLFWSSRKGAICCFDNLEIIDKERARDKLCLAPFGCGLAISHSEIIQENRDKLVLVVEPAI